jgi:hypothetical protein
MTVESSPSLPKLAEVDLAIVLLTYDGSPMAMSGVKGGSEMRLPKGKSLVKVKEDLRDERTIDFKLIEDEIICALHHYHK